MKKLSITFGTILLVLASFALSPVVKAARQPGQPTFTQIDVPGAILTIANSINEGGDIVGPYFDGDGNGHGFLLNNGAFTSIDVPGAIFTIATAINIQGQIVGLYFDTAGNTHGFALTAGVYTTVDFPGGLYTLLLRRQRSGPDNRGLRGPDRRCPLLSRHSVDWRGRSRVGRFPSR